MSETNTGVEDNSASKERAAGEAKRSAHGSVQIAEACAAAICNGRNIEYIFAVRDSGTMVYRMTQQQVAERIAKTLDAIHASPCEGTKPNA